MKLVKPSFEILEQPTGEVGIYKQIERVGRVCYKSEDKITEDSYKKFVEMLKSKQHGAMLEHGTVYLKAEDIVDEYGRVFSPPLKGDYSKNPYSCVTFEFYEQQPNELQSEFCNKITRATECITTNYRVLVENNWLDDLKYLCEPTEYHGKRITVKFTCDRGVSHEFVRHRVFSFAQESTRYCNYSKDKFENELSFIIPAWSDLEEGHWEFIRTLVGPEKWDILQPGETCEEWLAPDETAEYPDDVTTIFLNSYSASEKGYLNALSHGLPPQEARQILPNALKTELVMTGFVSDWRYFFDLRDDKDHAHPDAYALAHPLHEEFIKRGLV